MELWLFIAICGLNIQSCPLFIPSTMLAMWGNVLEIQEFSSETTSNGAVMPSNVAEMSSNGAEIPSINAVNNT